MSVVFVEFSVCVFVPRSHYNSIIDYTALLYYFQKKKKKYFKLLSLIVGYSYNEVAVAGTDFKQSNLVYIK